MRIILYSKKDHAYIVAFKNYFKMAEIPFTYKNVFANEEAKKHRKELYNGVIHFPTLFIDDELYLLPSTDEFNKIMKDLFKNKTCYF